MASITKYNVWRKNQETAKAIDWSPTGVLIKVMLVTNTYVPDLTHTTKTDITNEVTGNNYTARGNAITTASRTVVEAAGVTTVDGPNITWAQDAGGFTTARYAIIYYDSAVDGTSDLVGYIDMLADKGNVNGDLTIQWNASGIFISS